MSSVDAPLSPATAGGLRFTIFGFPTRVQLSFFLVIVILGISAETFARIAIWTGVATVSILWHELGHAFAARRLGSKPTIELYSFGGLTYWQPKPEASRWDHISVAMAGPVAGLLLGGVVALITEFALDVDGGDLRFFVVVVLWINVGWGLVNLLPVLPLDGGHVMAELLPGTREERWRRAAIVSIITGGAAAVGLYLWGLPFGAIVFAWAVFNNFGRLRAPAQAEKQRVLAAEATDVLERLGRRDPAAAADAQAVAKQLGAQGRAFKAVAVEAAAAAGDGLAAREILENIEGAAPPALYALVTIVETGGLQGLDELHEIFEREPDVMHARWLAVGLHRAGRLDELPLVVDRIPGERRDARAVESAAGIAEWLGRTDVAARVRGLVPE